MATDFREQFVPGERVWVDPKRITYTHLGFKHSVLSTLGLKVWAHGLRAWRAGFRQRATRGDPWQQGGVLVVRKGGALEYGFASATAGDHPPLEVVMKHASTAARS